jgi:soluble lytic murein transglycosylase-like protein
MYDRFDYPGLFAAYNAGPARYADHLATGKPLPGETRAYLATVTREEANGQPERATAPPRAVDPLFCAA